MDGPSLFVGRPRGEKYNHHKGWKKLHIWQEAPMTIRTRVVERTKTFFQPNRGDGTATDMMLLV